MSEADRNELIDAYFDALDEEDLDLVRPVLADDVVFESLSGPLEGVSGCETYMEDLRGLSNTVHELSLRLHDADAAVVEGTVTGESGDDTVVVDFCDVFEFDEEDEHLTRVAVYVNKA